MSKEFYERMWKAIKEEKSSFRQEVRNRKKSGVEYWQELYIFPILDKQEKIKFFVGVEPNITDRKKKEQFRDEFIGIVGHQLQNPLTTIRWILDWLSSYDDLTTRQKTAIEEIMRQVESTNELISDLLAIARVGKTTEIQKQQIDLSQEIERIKEEVQKRFPHVQVLFQEKSKGYTIFSNRTFVGQIFKDIIQNAVEYSNKESGKVVLSLRRAPKKYIFVCKDNGIGIPKKEQEKLFRPFVRASNAMQAKEKGTGLGLFIVKLMADTLGWNVRLQSRMGVGTKVSVSIPIHARDAKNTKS